MVVFRIPVSVSVALATALVAVGCEKTRVVTVEVPVEKKVESPGSPANPAGPGVKPVDRGFTLKQGETILWSDLHESVVDQVVAKTAEMIKEVKALKDKEKDDKALSSSTLDALAQKFFAVRNQILKPLDLVFERDLQDLVIGLSQLGIEETPDASKPETKIFTRALPSDEEALRLSILITEFNRRQSADKAVPLSATQLLADLKQDLAQRLNTDATHPGENTKDPRGMRAIVLASLIQYLRLNDGDLLHVFEFKKFKKEKGDGK
jgi:hypothetical protein